MLLRQAQGDTMAWRSRFGACVVGVAGAGALLASPAAGTVAELTVTPSTGLSDRQIVSVTITGEPNVSYTVMQCHNPLTNVVTGCGGNTTGGSSLTGSLTISYVVQRSFESITGPSVDCAAPQACQVTLWVGGSSTVPPTYVDGVPITFATPK